MSSRTLINLGLLVLVALLTTIAVYEPGLDKQTSKSSPLTNLQPHEIHTIRLSNPSNLGIKLEKREGTWYMTAPQQGAANSNKIEQLLGITVTSSHSRFPLPKERLKEFGLDQPGIRLELNELVMEFGNNEPLHFRRYVRIDDQLHLISNGFHHHLTAGVNDYLVPAK